MKNTLKILLLSIFAFTLWSCENEVDLIIATPAPGDFVIQSPEAGVEIILNKDLPDNPALTFVWTPVNYGPTPTFYDVQMAREADEWTESVTLAAGLTRTNVTLSVGELNERANMIGLIPDQMNAVKIRVRSYVGTAGEEKFSEETIISLQPYLAYFFRDLFLVGPASNAGWSNNNQNLAMFRNPSNENEYTYTGFLGADMLKLLERLGEWTPQWGLQGGILTSNPLHQSSDPDVFNVSPAGIHVFRVNTAERTHSFASFTGTVTTYNSIGIIGDGIGSWDNEIPLIQATVNGIDSHVWFLENLEVVGGNVKFRANNSWDMNWGANTEFSGTGEPNGPNIPISAGIYNVYFYSLTGHYMLIPRSN